MTTQIIQHQPDLVINSAAYTAVDLAEQNTATALAVNVDGAKHIAQVCNELNIPLLHYSTDYVFQGEPGCIYREDDSIAPCNHYGKTKLLSEQAIQQCTERYLILRISGVFALDGRNFINAILRAAVTKKTLRVVADQYASPTSADRIAHTSLLLATKTQQPDCAWGIYHYTSQPMITWHALAQHCIAQAHHYTTLAVKEIIPITSAEYAAPAPRPLHPQLDCNKIKTQFGIEQPNWKTDVNQMIKAYYETQHSRLNGFLSPVVLALSALTLCITCWLMIQL